MNRIKIAMAVLGGMCAFFGVQEWRVGSGATEEPRAVHLAEVEGGLRPDNNHWKLGEHLALFDAGVYWYTRSKYDRSELGPATRIDYYYYPVVSKEHPYIVQLQGLIDKYGSVEAIPEAELPAMENFAVLVKTNQFATIGDIPDTWDVVPSVQGLAINQIASLKGDESQLLKESFPGLDTDKLLILQAGRKPASAAKSLGMISGGSIVALVGVAWMIAGRKSA